MGGYGQGGYGQGPYGMGSVNIPDIQLDIIPYTALYTTPVPVSTITASESKNEGRTAVVLDFTSGSSGYGLYSRDLGVILSWPLSAPNVVRAWQPTLIPLPENEYNRPSDWMDGGYQGAKWVQGIIVTADSFGNPKTFSLQSSDDSSIHPLLECPATFSKQSGKAFSCVPFVAHNVRRIATDGVAWRVWNEQIVFEPYPELTMNWTPAMTALSSVGWQHVREMNIAHISTADLTLTLLFDSWPTISLTIPNSGGAMQKVKITIPPNKFKLVQPAITSKQPFRLFEPDLEMKAGTWGRSDSYRVLRPFGGPNTTGAKV